MKKSTWIRDVMFLGTIGIACFLLAVFLMETNQVQTPQTFDPAGEFQLEIRTVASAVDQAFYDEWKSEDLEITAAPRANDLTIMRRLALGLAGTLPSLEEIREFEKQPESTRNHWWVSRLLEDRRCSSHVAERLVRSTVGADEGEFILYRRRRFAKWLTDQIHKNRPYDEVVREILTGSGLWTDSPSVNFFTKAIADDQKPDPIVLAGKTSRAFLGMRIDCLQCHDDFLGTVTMGSINDPMDGEQIHFHSLAAFFANVNVSLTGIQDGNENKPYLYQLLDDDEETEIEPLVPFNEEIYEDANGDDVDSSLRERLAKWITHPDNRPFARVTVNRVWAIVAGKPLVDPVDDIPLDGPFPAAMEILADDFVENEFDLHRLIRIITETAAFQRQSQPVFEITDTHVENWSVFPLARLRPDQVAGAIVQSTSLSTIDSTAHIVTQLMKFGQQNEFVDRFGDAGEDEFLPRGETVTQRLLMLNGNMIKERITNGLSSPVRLRNLSPDLETAIETVYLAALTRRPNHDETRYFISQIEPLPSKEQNRSIQDLYWTLINSIEFTWNR